MRNNPTKKLERYRITGGRMASTADMGANGMFQLLYGHQWLCIVASDGSDWPECFGDSEPWEHVSVSTEHRCPTWEEMDYVKRLFWRDDETVLQLHVSRESHINHHPYCLHLWKPTQTVIPLPPVEAVGPR